MYNVRNITEPDYNFVLCSLKSAELYNTDKHIIFDIMLKTCDCYILTPANDDELICACIITCDDKLVWVYTKEIYRRGGIATHLLKSTNVSKEFMLKGKHSSWKNMTKRLHLKWNPYLIYSTLNFISQ